MIQIGGKFDLTYKILFIFSESSIPAKKRKNHHTYSFQPEMTIPQRSYNAPPAVPSTSHGTTAANNMMQIPVSLDNTVPLDL